MKNKKIIGRTEVADFPALSLVNVLVKVDTGAYTSCIHCSSIEEVEDDHVKFYPLDDKHHSFHGRSFELPIVKKTRVKSSNGESEDRFVVETTIKVMDEEYDITFTLTDRGEMKYPVLLGRKFLAGKFLVDVTKMKQ